MDHNKPFPFEVLALFTSHAHSPISRPTMFSSILTLFLALFLLPIALADQICGAVGTHDPSTTAFYMGNFFFKGLRMGSGQANVKAYNRELRDLIHMDRAKPSFLVSHRLPLDQAPEAYKNFDERHDGWTKVILKPNE